MSEANMAPSNEAAPLEPTLLQPLDYRGLSRVSLVPACRLTKEDLRRLYGILAAKASEALEKQLSETQRAPDKTVQDFEKSKEEARRIGGLTVMVQGAGGERSAAASDAVLQDDALPDSLVSVTFDSGMALKSYGVTITNTFRVHLDFSVRIPTNYDPTSSPTPNSSQIETTGTDKTWVAGVHQEVKKFLEHRKRPWRWIHQVATYQIGQWLVGLPAALWLTYRVDDSFLASATGMPGALRGAIDIYIFLVGFLAFRIVVAILRWLFPLVEMEGSKRLGLRAVAGTIVLTIVGGLIVDVISSF